MFCVFMSFGCDNHRLKFNIPVEMRPHFLPVTLGLCLLILQGYQVCMSSDHKQQLHNNSSEPSLGHENSDSVKEAVNNAQNGGKSRGKLNVHQTMHHSTKTYQRAAGQGQRQQTPLTKQQRQLHATRDAIKQHIGDIRKVHGQNKYSHMTGVRSRKLKSSLPESSTKQRDAKSLEELTAKTVEEKTHDRMSHPDTENTRSDHDQTSEVTASKGNAEDKHNIDKDDELKSRDKSQHIDKNDNKQSSDDPLDAKSSTRRAAQKQEHEEGEEEGEKEIRTTEITEQEASTDTSSQNIATDTAVDSKVVGDEKSKLEASEPSETTAASSSTADNKVHRSKDEAIQTDRHPKDHSAAESHPADPRVELPSVSTQESMVAGGGAGRLSADNEKKVKPSDENKQEEQPEVIKVPETTDDNLPSFDEWKQRMLAEQAEQEKTKNQEVQNMQPISAVPVNNKKGAKNVNYASVTCGAKIRASNPEAQHPGFILTENKDQYMINPCKVKKWFVVELCTPVQIQALEIGNLELFSSLPESFLVQVSEGFPTKDWKPVGTFHARNDRAIQSFVVENEQMYAHYIRVEMLSHYGAEHYCPLTVLRVFGLTVIEADEAEEEAALVPEDTDEMPIQDAEKDLTLFSSATDTVINLVKMVLNHGEHEKDERSENDTLTQETLTDAVQMKADVANSSAKNNTQEEISAEHSEPCMPDVSTNQETANKEQAMTPTEPHVPGATVKKTSSEDIVHGSPQPDVPSVEDEKSADIVTLIQRPEVRLRDYLTICHYCFSETKPACYSDRQSVCGYHRILTFIPPMCCLEPSQFEKAEQMVIDSLSSEHEQSTLSVSPTATSEATTVNGATVADVESTDTKGDQTQGISASNDQTILPSYHLVTPEGLHVQTPTETPPLTSVQWTDSIGLLDHSTVLMSTNLQADLASMELESSPLHVEPDVIDIRPSIVTPDKTDPAGKVSSGLTASPSLEATKATTRDDPSLASDSSDVPSSNGLPDIYAEEPSNSGQELDIDTMPAQATEDIQYQKITIGKKETTFMKLKNKIRSLELNLNLSSQYLEQLSQRYRKQMEEMYISLNKTINRLADTSRKAEEKDVKQQEHIANLLRQINALNASFEMMKGNVSVIQLELVERHLYLMIIEAAIFLLVLAWCLHRQEKNIRNLQDRTERIIRIHSRGSPVKPPTNKCIRRNSTDNTPTRPTLDLASTLQRRAYDDCDIRKSGSESDIHRILPSNLGFAHTGLQQNEAGRKKKKKRSSNTNKALTFGQLIGTSLKNSMSMSCHSSGAQLGTESHRPSLSINGCYMGHAPKKRQPLTTKSQMNGHVDRLSPDLASLNSREEEKNDDGQFWCHSSEHLIKQKSSHCKTPSLDRNVYSTLSVNGVDDWIDDSGDPGLTFGDYKDIIRKQN